MPLPIKAVRTALARRQCHSSIGLQPDLRLVTAFFRIIAFITQSADIRQILDHIGMKSEPPKISPARGPPLWDECDAHSSEGTQIEPDWDLAAQPAPDYEVDQRITW
jgi:hypothetical protein